jgi:hypothetical protein
MLPSARPGRGRKGKMKLSEEFITNLHDVIKKVRGYLWSSECHVLDVVAAYVVDQNQQESASCANGQHSNKRFKRTLPPKFTGWDVLTGRVCSFCVHENECCNHKFTSCQVTASAFVPLKAKHSGKAA